MGRDDLVGVEDVGTFVERGVLGGGVVVTTGSANRTRVPVEDSPDCEVGSGSPATDVGSPEADVGEIDGRSELGTGLGGGTG